MGIPERLDSAAPWGAWDSAGLHPSLPGGKQANSRRDRKGRELLSSGKPVVGVV